MCESTHYFILLLENLKQSKIEIHIIIRPLAHLMRTMSTPPPPSTIEHHSLHKRDRDWEGWSKEEAEAEIEAMRYRLRLRGGGYNSGDEQEQLYDDEDEYEDEDEEEDFGMESMLEDAESESQSQGSQSQGSQRPSKRIRINTDDTNSKNENDNDNDNNNYTYFTKEQIEQYRWKRPPVPAEAFNAKQSSLSLQWLDIDMYQDTPVQSIGSKRVLGKSQSNSNQHQQVPILRVYGVTQSGNSVALFIHGYTPYGYFAIPDHLAFEYENDVQKDQKLGIIRKVLNERLINAKTRGRGNSTSTSSGHGQQELVLGVQYVENCRSVMGYNTTHTRFLKVFVQLPGLVPTLKRIMEEGMSLPGMTSNTQGQNNTNVWDDNNGLNSAPSYHPFECNVPFVLRYMIDQDICGAGWLTLPEGTYQFRKVKSTHCQMEVDVIYNDIIPRKPEGEWNKIAPLRILSMDIECQGRKGHFPEAEQDPVIQIANVLSTYGVDDQDYVSINGKKQKKKKRPVQNVFTLKGCLPIVGAQIISSDNEEDMLLKWREFFNIVDVDIITGYNVQNFDIPYILDR